VEFDEVFAIQAPPAAVWPIISDPYRIAECFPGASLTEVDADGAYLGSITVRFGPTRATFSGRAVFDIDDAGQSGRLQARGHDRRGSSRATADADVRLTGDRAASQLRVVGTIEVSGPLGSFAESGGVHVARLLFADFGACVAAKAAPRAVDRAASAEPSGSTPATGPAHAAVAPVSGFALLRRLITSWFSSRFRRRGGRSS